MTKEICRLDPDLVFLDAGLQRWDASRVVENVTDVYGLEPRFVVLYGSGEEAVAQACLANGADKSIALPTSTTALRTVASATRSSAGFEGMCRVTLIDSAAGREEKLPPKTARRLSTVAGRGVVVLGENVPGWVDASGGGLDVVVGRDGSLLDSFVARRSISREDAICVESSGSGVDLWWFLSKPGVGIPRYWA